MRFRVLTAFEKYADVHATGYVEGNCWMLIALPGDDAMMILINPAPEYNLSTEGYVFFTYPYAARNSSYKGILTPTRSSRSPFVPAAMRPTALSTIFYSAHEFNRDKGDWEWGFQVHSEWRPPEQQLEKGSRWTHIPDDEIMDFCCKAAIYLCRQIIDRSDTRWPDDLILYEPIECSSDHPVVR